MRLIGLRYALERFQRRMEGLGFDLRREAFIDVLTSDIVKTSAIEGERLDPIDVRSSIAHQLGIDTAGYIPSDRQAYGIVELMLDATQSFDKPLTEKRLFDWHAALFPSGRSGMQEITVAHWRTLKSGPMQVVSGPITKRKLHFGAPSADRLKKEMRAFLAWIEEEHDIDLVLKAGIAHLWFVTIHPFEDGNGRIARAVGDMLLARADKSAERFYSLSTQIELERNEYYRQLERQQRSGPDISEWLEWFLACLERALLSSDKKID